MYAYLDLIFELLFIFGFLGIIGMALSGVGHHGVGGSAHGGVHHGVLGFGHMHGGAHGLHGGAHAGGHGQALPTHNAQGGAARTQISEGASDNSLRSMPAHTNAGRGLSILSFIPTPLDVCSICLGVGLVGVLVQKMVTGSALYEIAFVGGVVFDVLVVRQIFNFALKFVSKPSEGLEGMVASTAEATTRFDEKGMGMVKVVMEGQVVQLLATLDPIELASGVAVHKGDQVVLLDVDQKRNTCTVTRELSI